MRDGRYDDPLDLVWLDAARRMGMRVVRSDEVFASWDGVETLSISTPAGFDPDDSLAQMILHEACHALIEGPRALRRADWGLENIDDRDLVREHACHRLQAALADRHGLRDFMGVTTDWRPYWDALPPHPLAPGDDPAIELAREGWRRATQGPWAQALEDALAATAAIARVVRPLSPPESLWARTRAPHPTGFPPGDPERRCGGCAWLQAGTCLRAEAAAQAEWPACSGWEAPLDEAACQACGACCREAFHQVPVEPDAPIAQAHPDWVAEDEWGTHLPRPGGRCVALRGDGRSSPFLCADYARRPESCRDFTLGSDNCLEARRRVGLSA
ncbi:MAG: YkgJ family cysteine cluster protein [Alphaproteobacteria bacterium]|nr:YkgJ family cysteine cluster protein [Alphaproteobacteria bacterium]MCB9792164.1 YkgJ family cysteine cluster protein [Alphaproteobacteria bacterium]